VPQKSLKLLFYSMAESEKRGPIEKTEKGWPVNPIGVVALIVFGLVIIFLIVKPLTQKQTTVLQQNQQDFSSGGSIISPLAGEIVRNNTLPIKLSVDDESNVAKVQFWAKAYADGSWKVIGEKSSAPYTYDWQIPTEYQNKSIAITTHIINKDDTVIKDPGGWREGIIILSK